LTKAILFDLDGTLLDNKMDIFLSKYLEALTARVAHLIPPHRFVEQLMSSTKVMAGNNDPTRTNRQVFMEDFFHKVGHPPEVLMPIFEDFYANDFGRLRTYTRIKPEARAIMEEVFAWLVDKFNNPSGGASSKVVV
jgi:FMN phosphatase YigB (HAD superfamily)